MRQKCWLCLKRVTVQSWTITGAFVSCQLRREWWHVLFLVVFGITRSQWVLFGAINGVFDLAGPQEMLFFLLVF